jgi:pimeloyl-ACP methyl ester carboxylesterase
MNKPLRPPRLPAALFTTCGYFMPRLMFLQSRHAPQVHWGDVAVALQDFPDAELDLGSATFWAEWLRRWVGMGERYEQIAAGSTTPAGRSRALRSAAGCFHWAEFMYFDEPARKTALRQRVRSCFKRSLAGSDLCLSSGEVSVEGQRIPYFLLLPPKHLRASAALPLVICANGLDSMTEVEVLAIAESYLERGIAALLFEGPGQGLDVGCRPLRIDMEVVVAALVAHLQTLPLIDTARLGFFGVSFGGYLALRIAQNLGASFRCVVNLSGGPRVAPFARLPRRLKEDFRFAFMGGDEADMQVRMEALALDLRRVPQTEVRSVHGMLDDIFEFEHLAQLDRAWGERHTLVVHETEAHVCLNLINQHSIETADWVAARLLDPSTVRVAA